MTDFNASTNTKAVAYYRVSTKRQGNSGLGLEAQRQAVHAFARMRGMEILVEHTEIESGKNNERPELRDALKYAKTLGAVVLIAKLDRLARNTRFLLELMDSGVEFTAVDNPTLSRLTATILAAVAEDEARRISERTKAALNAARLRGVKLGGYRVGAVDHAAVGKRWANFARDRARAFAEPVQAAMKAAGSIAGAAILLNQMNHPTTGGHGKWHTNTIRRIAKKFNLETPRAAKIRRGAQYPLPMAFPPVIPTKDPLP